MRPLLPPVRFSPHFASLAAAILNLKSSVVDDGVWMQGGEAALAVALRLMANRHPERRQVVAPDFICPAVPRAIRAAGLEPVLTPIDLDTWFYRRSCFEKVLSVNTAAVISVAYHGMIPALPDWFDEMLTYYDTFALADWASCFGSELRSHGRAPLAIFSFGPGKSLPAAGGGLILPLTSEGYELLSYTTSLAPVGLVASSLQVARMLLQYILLSPAAWPLLPQSIICSNGEGIRNEERALGSAPAWVARYAVYAKRTLAEEIHRRRSVCRELTARLHDVGSLTLPSAEFIATGTCVRYPVIFETSALLERVRGELMTSGILRGGYRWDTHAAGPGGQDIASRVLTLPTHCSDSHILERIADGIKVGVGKRRGNT